MPFRNAKRPVSRRVSRRFAPQLVLFRNLRLLEQYFKWRCQGGLSPALPRRRMSSRRWRGAWPFLFSRQQVSRTVCAAPRFHPKKVPAACQSRFFSLYLQRKRLPSGASAMPGRAAVKLGGQPTKGSPATRQNKKYERPHLAKTNEVRKPRGIRPLTSYRNGVER